MINAGKVEKLKFTYKSDYPIQHELNLVVQYNYFVFNLDLASLLKKF